MAHAGDGTPERWHMICLDPGCEDRRVVVIVSDMGADNVRARAHDCLAGENDAAPGPRTSDE